MIELHSSPWGALLARLYWRDDVLVDHEMTDEGLMPVYEATPRRFAWILRPLMRFE